MGSYPTGPECGGRLRNGIRITLTVREVARSFEAAGVARTERSIVNGCQPNKLGIARLDAYFDPNERGYSIAPQSVELAIAEEKAKAAKNSEPDAGFGAVPKAETTLTPGTGGGTAPNAAGQGASRVKAPEQEVMDLKTTNRGKDYFIEQPKADRERLTEARKDSAERLLALTRTVGELETRLLQIEGPTGLPVASPRSDAGLRA